MKRVFSISILLILAAQLVKAQTITVTGTVKTNTGDFLHYAFIQDKQFKYATYSDSVGNFSLTANPASTLLITCRGYKDTLINIDKRTSLQVVLYPAITTASDGQNTVATSDVTNRTTVVGAFSSPNNNNTGNKFDLNAGAMIPVVSHKDETQGSRYFFNKWAHGYVINNQDAIVQNPDFKFNYDKMGGGLLLSRDDVSAIEINRSSIKSFTLYDNLNVPHVFENLPDVDPAHYVVVLSSGKKYKILKTVKTKFVKADYSTNGIASTGNNFDSYEDTYQYYVVNLQNNAKEKLDLKRKSIKTDFANEADKVNKFIADHSSDSIDDNYLSNLGEYMNN